MPPQAHFDFLLKVCSSVLYRFAALIPHQLLLIGDSGTSEPLGTLLDLD